MSAATLCRVPPLCLSSSFFLPLLFLPRDQRQAMFAVYAFCRAADDIVDDPVGLSDRELAGQHLAAWRQEVQAIFHGVPQIPLALRLQEAVQRFQLPEAPFHQLLDGMAMDLTGQRFATLAELETYCHRVAVTVGLLSVRVFGLHAGEGDLFAHHLGLAFQMTNILRDVAEDAAIGRLYLPMDWLAAEGVSASDIGAGRWSEGLARVTRRLAGEAERHYRQAWSALPPTRFQALLAPRIMAEIYHAYLEALYAAGFNVFQRRVRLSFRQRLVLAWRAWRRGEIDVPW